jgi:protein-L-isoaspartate(D-aspartate) O-methyltransferase
MTSPGLRVPPSLDVDELLRATRVPDLPLARALLAEQLRAAMVSEEVVAGFAAIPRHCFAPADRWQSAYLDLSVRAGPAWLLRPGTIARVLDAVPREPALRILEVGTGNGYQTALLALLAAEVLTVDVSQRCVEWARPRLQALGLSHVTCTVADVVSHGIADGDFDCVVVTTALSRLPATVTRTLSPREAVVIAPVRGADGAQRLIRYSFRDARLLHAVDLGACAYPEHSPAQRSALRGDTNAENADHRRSTGTGPPSWHR